MLSSTARQRQYTMSITIKQLKTLEKKSNKVNRLKQIFKMDHTRFMYIERIIHVAYRFQNEARNYQILVQSQTLFQQFLQ